MSVAATLPQTFRMRQPDPQTRIALVKHNRCPFGTCTQEAGEDTETGYCRHLLGWTRDGVNVAVRTLGSLAPGTGQCEVLADGGDKVKKTDRVVPMRSPDARVYRWDADAPVGSVLPEQPKVPPLDPVLQDVAAKEAQDGEIAELKATMKEQAGLIRKLQDALKDRGGK